MIPCKAIFIQECWPFWELWQLKVDYILSKKNIHSIGQKETLTIPGLDQPIKHETSAALTETNTAPRFKS